MHSDRDRVRTDCHRGSHLLVALTRVGHRLIKAH
jgi:hypothetical protein